MQDIQLGERFQQLRLDEWEKRKDTNPRCKFRPKELSQELSRDYGYVISESKIKKIESNTKGASITPYVLRAYRDYFGVSIDWLCGGDTKQTDGNLAIVSKQLGLTDDSIEMLKLLNNAKNKYYPLHKRCLNALNTILSDFYQQIKAHAGNNNIYIGCILYDIWEYIHADSFYTYTYNKELDEREKKTLISIYNDDEIKDFDFNRFFELRHVAKYRSQNEIMKKLDELSQK